MQPGIDLALLPLYRLSGHEMTSHPGLLALTPPKQCARGREKDTLLLLLALSGTTVATASGHIRLLEQTARAFYETPGSLTFALRAAAEALNEELLGRNLRASGQNAYLIGSLILGSLREKQLYLLESGSACVLHFGRGGVQRLFDSSLSGRGLGTGQSTQYALTKIPLEKGDKLLFCGNLPPEWNEPPRVLRVPSSPAEGYKALMDSAEGDINAALAHVESPGSGAIRVLPPPIPKKPAPPPSAYAIPPERTAPKTESAAEAEPDSNSTREPPPRPSRSPRGQSAARAALSLFLFFKTFWEKFLSSARRILPRFLPTEEETVFSLPSWTMLLVALAIPVLVGTMASVVYFRYGPSVQYETYLMQAKESRSRAEGETDPVALRVIWEETLFYLDKAESYRTTAETKAMREEAQQKLDTLLGIVHLSLRPALTGLPREVSITRMAATETDLYLLNAADGSILRAFLSNGAYQLDETFSCAPDSYEDGKVIVGRMVSLLTLPRVNALNAAVVGIDIAGNLLYCAPNQVPKAVSLIPPETNWGAVTAMDFGNAGALYVMDAPQRAVWVYQGKAGAFLDAPTFFFNNEIPPMDDVVDIAANGDDVFFLHQDSHLSLCTYSRLQSAPTRCADPAPLSDPHPATQGSDIFSEAHFTQLLTTSAPDSSLLLLDSQTQTVFLLGVRSLALQSRLRPPRGEKNPFGQKPITAMAVTPNHILFLASGNQVYFAMNAP